MAFYENRTFRWLTAAAFVIYLAVLFDFVFFSAQFGRVNAEALRYRDMNLVPFSTIRNYIRVRELVNPSVFIINILGNIAAFVPFGFLLPVVFKFCRKFIPVLILSLMLTAFIELTQGYLGVGVMDVDDVILNVAGGILGYIIFLVGNAVLHLHTYKR